jgi:Tfp pilus assembly protein PilW
MTKTLLAGAAALAAVLILPAVASAQNLGAAATLPNTFDRPASQAAPTPPVAAATVPSGATVTPSDPAKVAAAETALKATIAAMQAGTPNYDAMTPDLAAKVREQAATVTPLIHGFGALNGLSHVGTQNGAELFLVMFANAPTQWIIGLTPEGKINALLFRPAPAAPAT